MQWLKNLGIALLINVFYLFLCLGFSHLRYGAIDDYFMAGILSGMFGEDYNVHLPFVNALYGYVLLPLYHLFPEISWYYVGEIASIFISLTVITYIIICKAGKSWGTLLGIILVACYAKDFYIVLQFTQCAEALSAAGILLVLNTVEGKGNNHDRSGIILIALGVLLVWWGSWMRWDAFLMGVFFLIGVLCLGWKNFLPSSRQVLLSLLFIYGGAFSFHYINQSFYHDSEYKKFVEFQPFRVLLGDGSFYDEQAVYEDLQELGESPKDFDLLKKWYFYDTEVFAPESVKVIENLIGLHEIHPTARTLPLLLVGKLGNMARSPYFIAWLFFCVYLVFSGRKNSIYLWCSLAIIGVLESYLLYLNRPVYRVEIGFFLYATVMSIVFWKKKLVFSNKMAGIVILLAVTLSSLLYYNAKDSFRSPNDGGIIQMDRVLGEEGYADLFQYIDSMPDSVLFLMPMDTYMDVTEHRLPPYLNEPRGSWKKIHSTGYWTPYYPDVEKCLQERGVANPMRDLVKENVFFVSDIKFGTSLVDFLQMHHYDSVLVDTVKNFARVSVLKYSVVSKEGVE